MPSPLSLTHNLMEVIVKLEYIELELKAATKNADDVVAQVEIVNATNMLKAAYRRFMSRLDEPKLPEFNQQSSIIPEKNDGIGYR